MVISKTVSVVEESGRETMGVALVGDKLRVDVVTDVPGIFQSRGATEHVVTNRTKEGLPRFCDFLETGEIIHALDVRLEGLLECDNGSAHIPFPRGKNVAEHTGQLVQGSRERSFPGPTVSMGTYWYPSRGAMAGSKTTGPSPPALAWI